MLELLLSLLLAIPANFPTSPIVSSGENNGSLVCVHADSNVSMVSVVPGERTLVCSTTAAPQGPAQQLPTISTSWKSDDGSTHTVTTPIVSSTPTGLESAVQQHRDLVRMLKVIYPPAKP